MFRSRLLVVPVCVAMAALIVACVEYPLAGAAFLFVVAAVAVPSRTLPAVAILSWYGFHIPQLSASGGGLDGIFLSEAILAIWLLRETPGVLSRGPRVDAGSTIFLGLVAWLLFTTFAAGSSGLPLFHLLLLGICMTAVSNGARIDYRYFVGALWIVMVMEVLTTFEGFGQRLYGSDPAQLGFIAIAVWALTPVATLSRLPRYLVLSIPILVVAFTQTRSIYFALCIAAVARLIGRFNVVSAIVTFAGGLLFIAAVAQPLTDALGLSTNSLDLRLASLRGALEISQENFGLGAGWAYRDSDALAGITSQGYSVYNLLLSVVVAGGIVAGILLIAFLGVKLWQANRYDLNALLLLIAFVVIGVGEMPLFPGSIMAAILLLVIGRFDSRGVIGAQSSALPTARTSEFEVAAMQHAVPFTARS